MRIVFMGSADLACPSLDMLIDSPEHEVVAVVTQPDRPMGRKQKAGPCPLKAFAMDKGMPLISPEKIGEASAVEQLRNLSPDIIVLVAYGQYIPSSILSIPPAGAINLHPSLLPKYRGAAPIQRAVANGEKETGVTILYVSREMDAGDIIMQESVAIGEEETAESLSVRLAENGARLICRVLELHGAGEVPRVPQDEKLVTFAPKLKKEDGRVRWRDDAAAIKNQVRAFQPWPCCYCEVPETSGCFVRLYGVRIEKGEGEAGEVLSVKGEGPLVATGKEALRLLEVQPPGKKRMSGSAFLCGHRLERGTILG